MWLSLIPASVRRHFRSAFRAALCALIPLLATLGIFAAAGPVSAGLLSQNRLNLVFCDLEGSSFFDSLMGLMMEDDTIKETVTVRKLGYDDALSELSSGGADAAVIFPENFISDMTAGINKPVKVLSTEADPAKSVLVREFMRSAAAELSAAQSAINTVWFNMDRENMGGFQANAVFSGLVLEYTSKAFARSIYYTFEIVPSGLTGGSPLVFILTSALAALVFFASLTGVRRIISERVSGVTVRLKSSGMSGFGIAMYHFVPIYIKQLFLLSLAALFAMPAVTMTAKAVKMAEERQAAIYAPYTSEPSLTGQPPNVSPFLSGVLGGTITGGTATSGTAIGGAAISGTAADDAASSDDAASDQAASDQATSDAATSDAVTSDAATSDAVRSDLTTAKDRLAFVMNNPSIAGLPVILEASVTSDNARNLQRVIGVMALFCLLTSTAALFLGSVLRRAESAEIFIVTLGIAMAIVGGAIIPYPYLPESFQAFGAISFYRQAQITIADALFAIPVKGAFESLSTAWRLFIPSASVGLFTVSALLFGSRRRVD